MRMDRTDEDRAASIKYHTVLDREVPERWRAWTDIAPAVTGYGETPGEAVDSVARSEDVLAYITARLA